jgi:hypothetical protein
MSALDNLPPDQRAVLQMVLQRGRSYDEIASLLSIDRAAVRQRALDAFDVLTPVTALPGPERALVTDYLLGQLPDRVAEEVYSFLQASDADRAWAEALAGVLGPLAPGSLPEIPAGAPLGADDGAARGVGEDSDPPDLVGDAEEPGVYAAPVAEAPEVRTRPTREPRQPRAPREPRPSSRRGGAILLSTLGALIVAVIVVVLLTSGGSNNKHGGGAQHTGSGTTAQSTSTTVTTTTATTGTTGTTGTTTTQILAQLNLSSPTGAKATLGIAQVIRVDGVVGVALDAQGLPPNTAHNAYAVWLYNSSSSFKFVGFVQSLVGKSGKVATEGKLPAGASAYHRLLITLETNQNPSAPGEVVLSGPFSEHS